MIIIMHSIAKATVVDFSLGMYIIQALMMVSEEMPRTPNIKIKQQLAAVECN